MSINLNFGPSMSLDIHPRKKSTPYCDRKYASFPVFLTEAFEKKELLEPETESLKKRILKAIDDQEEDTLGVVVYQQDARACLGSYQKGVFNENPLSIKWSYYTKKIQPKIFSALEERQDQILYGSQGTLTVFKKGTKREPIFSPEGDFALQSENVQEKVSMKNLVEKGSFFLQSYAVLSYLANQEHSIKIACSKKTLELFKLFIEMSHDDFENQIDRDLENKKEQLINIKNLFEMSHLYFCKSLELICVRVLCKHAALDPIVFKDLEKYQIKEFQNMRNEDEQFELEL